MATPSQNKYYNHPDLAKIKDQLADIMGIGSGSASADRNRLTDLRGVSKLEGNMMDNRATDSIWQSLQKVLPGMTPGETYTANLGLHGKGHNRALAVTEQMMRDPKVRKAFEEADLAGEKTKSLRRRGGVEQALLDNKPIDHRALQTGDAWVAEHEFQKERGGEKFARDMRTLLALQGNQPGVNLDPTGSRGAAADILKALESKATIGKTESYTDWNKERKKYVKLMGDKNVSLVEQKINSLKGLTTARKKEILNRVLNNIAELDQKILTEKGKRQTEAKRAELVELQMFTEIERELTQQEKTETEWYKGVDTQTATELKEEKILGAEEDTKKKKAQRKQEELKLRDMPAETKLKLQKLTKQVAKIDADIGKIEAGRKNQLAMMALNQAKKFKVHNEQEIAKLLLPYRKDLLEAQAGSAMKGTYETLMYPNKHLKSTTSEDYADGTIPTDGEDEPDPELNKPPEKEGGLSLDNIVPNWEKFKAWLSGGAGGGTVAGQGQPKGNPMEMELAKLSQQPVANWTPDQRNRYIHHAVQNLGLDPKAAASLLQRAIQAQGPPISR